MAKIVPAVLEQNKADFMEKLGRFAKLPGVERIQVDFGDGQFVPNTMLAASEIEVLSPAFHFEAHLMVKSPSDFFEYQLAGFKTLLVHYEAFPSAEAVHAAISQIRSAGLRPGLCLKNQTPVSVAAEFYPEVGQVQLMAIEPGFQGRPFLENTFERVSELRRLLPNVIIEVDGGVSAQNARRLAQSGADLLIAGSALLRAPDMLLAYNQLVNEVK